MAHIHHSGARAPGLAVPDLASSHANRASLGTDGASPAGLKTSHKCKGPGCDPEALANHKTTDSRDCAAKATARAAELGIEARPLADGAWLLRHAKGATIGKVQGVGALSAAVAGFETAANDVRQLVQRMRGGAAA